MRMLAASVFNQSWGRTAGVEQLLCCHTGAPGGVPELKIQGALALWVMLSQVEIHVHCTNGSQALSKTITREVGSRDGTQMGLKHSSDCPPPNLQTDHAGGGQPECAASDVDHAGL